MFSQHTKCHKPRKARLKSTFFILTFCYIRFVLANKEESFAEGDRREIRIKISEHNRQPNKHVEDFQDDDLDLKFLQGTIAALKGTVKSAGDAFRVVGDTTAGITGGGLKAAGASFQGLGGTLDMLSSKIGGHSEDHRRKNKGPVHAVTSLSRTVAAGGMRIVGMASEEIGDVVYRVGRYTEKVTSGTGNLFGAVFDGLEDILEGIGETFDVLDSEISKIPPASSEMQTSVQTERAEAKEQTRTEKVDAKLSSLKEKLEAIQREPIVDSQPDDFKTWLVNFTKAWWWSLFSTHHELPSLAPQFAVVCLFSYILGWRAGRSIKSTPTRKGQTPKRHSHSQSNGDSSYRVSPVGKKPRSSYIIPKVASHSQIGNMEECQHSRTPPRTRTRSRSHCLPFEKEANGETSPTGGNSIPKRSPSPHVTMKPPQQTHWKVLQQLGGLATLFFVWIYICTLDQSSRRRLSLISESKAWSAIMIQQQFNHLETANWLNFMIASLWNLKTMNIKTASMTGGLSLYLSDMAADTLISQLEMDKPDSVTSWELTEFFLGTIPPVIREVQLVPNPDNIKSSRKIVTVDVLLDVAATDFSVKFTFKLSTLQNAKLPHTTVQVTNFLLQGMLTLSVELLPEYPFLGLLMFSFKTMPEVSFSLKPLQGIDLSAIPGVGTWVTLAVEKSLAYYVYPQFYSYDLEEFFCPLCTSTRNTTQPLNNTKPGSQLKTTARGSVQARSSASLPGWETLKQSKTRRGLDTTRLSAAQPPSCKDQICANEQPPKVKKKKIFSNIFSFLKLFKPYRVTDIEDLLEHLE